MALNYFIMKPVPRKRIVKEEVVELDSDEEEEMFDDPLKLPENDGTVHSTRRDEVIYMKEAFKEGLRK